MIEKKLRKGEIIAGVIMFSFLGIGIHLSNNKTQVKGIETKNETTPTPTPEATPESTPEVEEVIEEAEAVTETATYYPPQVIYVAPEPTPAPTPIPTPTPAIKDERQIQFAMDNVSKYKTEYGQYQKQITDLRNYYYSDELRNRYLPEYYGGDIYAASSAYVRERESIKAKIDELKPKLDYSYQQWEYWYQKYLELTA